jgi:NAD(P)-dependent dehydrogenase (short-subunit alcohol dehydrogenase family)
VEPRNASAAVIGAGDYIGAAIAKRFAAQGFTIFAGRRNGEKLAPLVAEIEAGGGHIVARSLVAIEVEERRRLDKTRWRLGAIGTILWVVSA